jgi:hypothetical protein
MVFVFVALRVTRTVTTSEKTRTHKRTRRERRPAVTTQMQSERHFNACLRHGVAEQANVLFSGANFLPW